MAQHDDDISTKTLGVLVVLVLAVSFIGAWVSITQLAVYSSTGEVRNEDSATAKVSFEIVEPPEPSTATGEVLFEIQSPPEGG
jgi:hypothetical protein